MIAHNAESKRILAEMKEKRARAADATDDVKLQARQARQEAKRAAKEARVEAYKHISEEKARERAVKEAQKEADKAEKRMLELDKKLEQLKNKS